VSQIPAGDFISIGVGLIVLAYVMYCLINQKFWNRRINGWGTKDEQPKIFKLNIIIGILIAIWTIAVPLIDLKFR
tara:strand:+ start:358 stop:582 length:225 start_codon:yes stop_codon:yes gene_type:complete